MPITNMPGAIDAGLATDRVDHVDINSAADINVLREGLLAVERGGASTQTITQAVLVSPGVDALAGEVVYCPLTSSCAMAAPLNPANGMRMRLVFTQPAGGNCEVTLPAAISAPGWVMNIGGLANTELYIEYSGAAGAWLYARPIVSSYRGYQPKAIQPVDVIYSGQTSGVGSQTWSAATHDSSDFVFGSESVYQTTLGAGAQKTIASTLGAALDLTGKCLVLYIKETGLANNLAGYPRIYLGDAGLTNAYYWKLTSSSGQPYHMDGEWLRVTLPFGTATIVGSPSRASLAVLTIQIFDNSGGVVTFKLGGVFTMSEPAAWPNGVCSVVFDDGYGSQFTQAKPYMERYGYRGTCYLITETLWNHANFSSYMTLAQVQTLELAGWEIGSHAFTAANHNLGYPVIGDAAALADMAAARDYLYKQGFRSPDHFAYPLGNFQAGTIADVGALFASGRSISSVGGFPDETFPPANLTRLRALPVSAVSTLSTVEGYVTAAKANKEWLILVMHDIVSSASGNLQFSIANFQALMDFISAAGLPVRPVSEVLKSG